MNNPRYRKYPRVYKKADAPENTPPTEEKSIVLSMGTAVGILAITLLNGVVLGCLLSKKID